MSTNQYTPQKNFARKSLKGFRMACVIAISVLSGLALSIAQGQMLPPPPPPPPMIGATTTPTRIPAPTVLPSPIATPVATPLPVPVPSTTPGTNPWVGCQNVEADDITGDVLLPATGAVLRADWATTSIVRVTSHGADRPGTVLIRVFRVKDNAQIAAITKHVQLKANVATSVPATWISKGAGLYRIELEIHTNNCLVKVQSEQDNVYVLPAGSAY